MGAAASTTAARTQVTDLLNDKNGPKPADASDIQVSFCPTDCHFILRVVSNPGLGQSQGRNCEASKGGEGI